MHASITLILINKTLKIMIYLTGSQCIFVYITKFKIYRVVQNKSGRRGVGCLARVDKTFT